MLIIVIILISCGDNSLDPTTVDKVKYDYFPIKTGNTWLFSLIKENGHRGWTEDKFYGNERWTVKSINRSISDTTYMITCERSGILTKLRTIEKKGNPVSITTIDTINLFKEFTIREDINHLIQINHEYFPYSNSRQRYYSSIADTLIKFDLYSSDYEVYRKGVGLIKRFNNQSSNASLNLLKLELIKANFKEYGLIND